MKFDNKKLINKLAGTEKTDPVRVHNRFLRSGRFSINVRFIVVILAALLVLVAAVSTAVYFSERGDDEGESDTSQTEEISAIVSPASLNTNFILALTKSSTEGLDFLGVMSVDTENATVNIRPVNVKEYAIVDTDADTLEGHFNTGGINRLQTALINCEKVAAARYIVCSEENFTYFLSHLDPIALTVPEDINYNYGGINLTIEGGSREFLPDELMKYFCYLTENCGENSEQITTVFRAIAQNFFDAENENRLPELYGEVVNFFSTNISAADIQNYYKTINSLAGNGGVDGLAFS